MATKPTADQIKTALTTVLTWLTVMADGTARPAVLTPTGKVDSEDSANSPARLAWRCNGARMPIVGMLAAIAHGWDAAPKSWPTLREHAPNALVVEGRDTYGLAEEHPAASWDAVADQSDRAMITALYKATRDDVTAPFDVIAAVLTPTESEKTAKLPEEQRQMVNAVMQLSESNPARATLIAGLSEAGKAEVERRTKAKAEKAERRKAAKPEAETTPEAEPEAKAKAEKKPAAKPAKK